MKIKENRLRKIIRESIYRELGRQAINEGRVDEFLGGLFGGGGDKIEVGPSAKQELDHPESGIRKLFEKAVAAGLEDFSAVLYNWDEVVKAWDGKALDAKNNAVKRIKQRWDSGGAVAGDRASGTKQAIWEMLFEKGSTVPIYDRVKAMIRKYGKK
tara:strand:+ start:495 stop:962 length:468 start_codon:yes stop_codon:yes gene_type:complete